MLLTLAALALSPQTAPADEGECIIAGLANAKRTELAIQFAEGAMTKVAEIADEAAVKCAITWKWSDEVRDWHIVHSGAYAAMVALESQLPATMKAKQLEALFNKLPKADQYGLTNEGGAKLDEAAYKALADRIAASLKAEKLDELQVGNAGNWFLAYAQFIEADAHIKAAKAPK